MVTILPVSELDKQLGIESLPWDEKGSHTMAYCEFHPNVGFISYTKEERYKYTDSYIQEMAIKNGWTTVYVEDLS